MALRVFISYSGREDQVLGLRLQALASSRPGLQVYVPPASTRSRRSEPTGLDLEELTQSNFVLAIVNGTIPPSMQKEVELAHKLGKPIIPIVLRGRTTLSGFVPGQRIFYLDPLNPIETENEIINYLSTADLGKANQKSLVGLVLLALGLMILAKE